MSVENIILFRTCTYVSTDIHTYMQNVLGHTYIHTIHLRKVVSAHKNM